MRLKQQVLLIFCLILNLRMLTELPRAISLIGWMNIPEFDFNRALSFILIVFCSVSLLLKRTITVPRLIRRNALPVVFLFLGSIAMGIRTFSEIGMPYTGIFVVASRFVLEVLLILFVVNFVLTENDLALVFNYFFKTTLSLILIMCFLQVVTSSYSVNELTSRMQGPFGSPTTLGSFMLLFIALTLYYYGQRRSSLFWLVLTLEFAVLFFSGAVAIITASLLLVLFIAHRQEWHKLKYFYRVFPFIGLIVIVGLVLKWETILVRISQLADLQTLELPEGSSIRWRLDAFGHYLALLSDNIIHWFVGMGMGTQRFILHPDYPHSLFYLFDAPGTHNDYLAVLIDFGLLGLIGFLACLRIVYRMIKRAELYDDRLYFLRFYFLTILFVILSENYIDQLVTFVFIVFLVGIINVRKQHPLSAAGLNS